MKLCPKCQKHFSDDANFCPVDAARLVPLETVDHAPGHAPGQPPGVAADSISAKFTLGKRLGGNRTGAVHRATDVATGQPAVVKIVAPAVVALPGIAQRLERELKQLERVHSAGVAKVLASGKRGDDCWVALELLDGAQTLAQAISARGPLAIDGAAHLVEVIGEALIEAAQVGVVHRDLAPKNILFAPSHSPSGGGEVKLINFSLPVPATDKVAGVAEFVAPEQHDGKPVDQRSNLYSLGALYYFVLTGQTVQHDAGGAIKPPSALAPVPAAVEAVIVRALDRSPTKRFLTVRQFVDEVNRVASGDAADLGSTQPMGRAGKPRAELVQTLLGVRGGGLLSPNAPAIPSTVVGVVAPSAGAAGLASAVASTVSASPERSPWAPPVANAGPANAGPAMPGPVMSGPAAMPAPGQAMHPAPPVLPPSAVVPAAAVPVPAVVPVAAAVPVAAPVVAAPVVAAGKQGAGKQAAGKQGAGKQAAGKPAKGEDAKGKFRETMWFKKGELDAQAAQAAAEEHATTGSEAASDRADSLPIDERYKDDGSLSRTDKQKYSLRTGSTTMTPAVRDPGTSAAMSDKVSEDALIGEMKSGRNVVMFLIAIGVVAIGLIIFLIVR